MIEDMPDGHLRGQLCYVAQVVDVEMRDDEKIDSLQTSCLDHFKDPFIGNQPLFGFGQPASKSIDWPEGETNNTDFPPSTSIT